MELQTGGLRVAVFGPVAAVQKASVARLDAKAYRLGAVWRERQPARNPPLPINFGWREGLPPITDVAATQPRWTAFGAIFLPRAASPVWNCRERRKGARPPDPSFFRGAQRRGSRQRPKMALLWWAGRRPLFCASPSPGGGLAGPQDRHSWRNWSITLTEPLRPTCCAFRAERDAFRAVSPAALGGQRSRNRGEPGAERQVTPGHDERRLWPYFLHGAFILPASGVAGQATAGGNRFPTGPGELFATPRRPFLRSRFREPVPPEASASRGKPSWSRLGTFSPSSGPVLQPRFRRVGAAEDMRCRGNSGRSRTGNGHPLGAVSSGLVHFDVDFTHVLGSYAPDQVPDSVTDIDRRRQRVPIHRAAMPALLVDGAMASSSTPAVGSSVRRLANAAGGTVNLIG